MEIDLSKTSLAILDVLYHYHFAWKKDLDAIIGLSEGSSHVQDELNDLLKRKLVNSKVLAGGQYNKGIYALTEKGYQYLKKEGSFPEQDIEERDLRLESLSNGFLKHEGLVAHAAGVFFRDARAQGIELVDRRDLLSHIDRDARQNRESDRVRLFQVRSMGLAMKGTQRPDDILLLLNGSRPTLVFIEVDRGTESLRPRVGKTIKGQVAAMMNVYIEAYRKKFFRTYFGDMSVRVMFIISTNYSGQKRKKNFEELWREVGEGRDTTFPCFTTLEEFDQHGPIKLLYLP